MSKAIDARPNRFRFTSDPEHIVDALVELTGGEREIIAAAVLRTYTIGYEVGEDAGRNGGRPLGEWRDAMIAAGYDARAELRSNEGAV